MYQANRLTVANIETLHVAIKKNRRQVRWPALFVKHIAKMDVLFSNQHLTINENVTMCYRAYVAPVSDITGTELRVAENSRDEKRVISVIPRRDTFHVQLYNARTRRQSTSV